VRLQREHRRIQERIDAMYLDKLDGRINAGFFDAKAAEMRSEQSRINVEAHGLANQSYVAEGVNLLRLSQRAHALFERQPAKEKRRLMDFVVSKLHLERRPTHRPLPATV